ncbi:MAG: phosphate propanoyltransferase [Elusimicrobiota bacterium]
MVDENLIKKISEKVVQRMEREKKPIIANISNRHVHLTAQDLETLFGSGYKLNKDRDLMQPGEFATREFVIISGPKGKIEKVRVLGPVRKQTQVEISRTDSFVLGVDAPVRLSGDLAGSAPISVMGPQGRIDLKEGCIVAKRHVHMTPKDAQEYEVKDHDIVKIKAGIGGPRGTIFDDVIIRVREDMALECHIDVDEGNACFLKNGDKVIIL